jgi:8-oxo-dGTP pyrophosphatase MutT (NUDIX family)
VSNLRLAACVILAREAPSGVEIYMLRRSARSAFAPDAFVFPGGTLDPSDAGGAAKARTLGLDAARIGAEFRARIPPELPSTQAPIDGETAGTLKIAALRELFEEAGVLFARGAGGEPVAATRLLAPAIDAGRDGVRGGRSTFAAFLESHDWFADAGALTLFSHWITPSGEPRRYDTHFFLAVAPAGQAAVADADETHDGLWISPHEALVRYREGTFHLVYPTIKHLERLAPFATIESVRAFAASKPIVTIEPSCAPDEGFVMPAALENAW